MAEQSWNRSSTEETGFQSPEGPILCANNCGFFGNQATMNFCSKCYRDHVLKGAKQHQSSSSVRIPSSEKPFQFSEQPSTTLSEGKVETSSPSIATPSSSAGSDVPRPPSNRCRSCNKRVGVLGFTCRCEGTFCPMHRLPEKHACSFDFKSAGREAITRANPVVKADKLGKI